MKKIKMSFIALTLAIFSQSVLAKDSCKVYFDELAMLKTVEGYEVDHGRFELIQLLENNLSRKGYSFVTSEKKANFKLETYAVNETKNGKCAEAQVLLTDSSKGKSAVTDGQKCSTFGIIPNVNEIGAAKIALKAIPQCDKF